MEANVFPCIRRHTGGKQPPRIAEERVFPLALRGPARRLTFGRRAGVLGTIGAQG